MRLSLLAAAIKRIAQDPPVAGDTNAGFVAERSEAQVISAADLADAVGLTTGVVVTAGAPHTWLEFTLDGKQLYVARRGLRHTVSWDQLYNLGLVYDKTGVNGRPTYLTDVVQNKTVQIGNRKYRVRLMDATEWTRLMIPMATWAPAIANRMNIGNLEGAARWMTDYVGNVNTRAWRGWTAINVAGSNPSSLVGSSMSWSPVLEPI